MCNICFASFIEHVILFVISLLWQTVLTLCCRPCHFLFFDVYLLHFCVAAASILSAMQCLFLISLSIFFHVVATSIPSASRHLFIYSLLFFLCVATASMPLVRHFLFVIILLFVVFILQFPLNFWPGALSSY
jgi:hypothetical protein